MTNRITGLIERYEERIEKLGGVGLDGRPTDSLHDEMRLTMSEFVKYQELQASAHASELITTDEAMTVYRALGGESFNPDWPKGTSLGTKVAITQLMGELVSMRIKAKTKTLEEV